MAGEPWRLSATEAAARIGRGELTSEALVGSCLERIAEREGAVRAWAHLDPGLALAQARERDAQAPRGPLHGVPVGIKDIVDTASLPTEHGTPVHAGRRPAADAACVTALLHAGAVVLGKTVTTELATYQPSVTRNPHDPSRTPGGSSSGSAAAVADGMVPLAIGSQTAGSVVRPAAYCGVLGLKPTHGALDLTGVLQLSARLDTLGLFAREPEDLALALGALGGAALSPAAAEPSFAFARTPWWEQADEDGRAAVEAAAARLAEAGARVRETELPPSFAPLPEAQNRLMAHDVARTRAWELEHHAEDLSDVLRGYAEGGRAITDAEADDSAALGAVARAALEDLLGPGEVLLVPAVTGEPPPRSAGSTGDPLFCRPWTLLGVPALAVPGPVGPSGLPIGVQLVAGAGQEAALLRAGASAFAALR
jgi:Asp-tRNA(Asn)/Glu-tRNA(Gln) amidotransferase A subunit family amidase